MKKHAYLIIAHDKFDQLAFLISLLDDPRNDIFIHIDKRSKVNQKTIEMLKSSAKASTVHLAPRLPVFWGDYSQIKCELNLYQTAINQGQYTLYHLLSGSDLPLYSQDYIHHFFADKSDKIFITRNDNRDFLTNRYYSTLEHYHFSTRWDIRTASFPIKKCLSIYRRLENYTQRLLKLDRLKGKREEWGVDSYSNWRTLDHQTVQILLSETEFIKKYFKHTFCADEIYLSLVLTRHNLLDKIYFREMNHDLPDEFQGNLRYINWWDGRPYEWTDSDKDKAQLEKGKELGHLFSRKFNLEKYPALKEFIISKITEN